MSATQLRKNIKRAIDRVPPDRLASLADYVQYLNQTELLQRIARAETQLAAKKGVSWRKVRKDV